MLVAMSRLEQVVLHSQHLLPLPDMCISSLVCMTKVEMTGRGTTVSAAYESLLIPTEADKQMTTISSTRLDLFHLEIS